MNKKLDKKLITIIVTSLALLSFFVLMMMVICGYVFNIDQFNVIVAKGRNDFWTNFFKIFTYLGSFYILLIAVIVAFVVLFFVLKKKRFAFFSAGCFGVVCLLNLLFKLLIKRTRPTDLMIIAETGYSFPSGHAMMSFAFFTLLIFFVWKYLKNKPLKIVLTIVFSILIITIGFSRIYLGVHYLTDILAGWLLTLAVFGIFILLVNSNLLKSLKDGGKNE